MADFDKAVRALYSNVVTIDGVTAYDANGNEVTIDQTQVDAWVDPEAYKQQRANEYPSIGEQLDYIYHNGVEAWKTDIILPIKNKYPKGSE